MHEDDAKFEASVALYIAKLESMTAPQDPIVRAYAFVWLAAHCAGSRATFDAISRETSGHFPWGLAAIDRDGSAG